MDNHASNPVLAGPMYESKFFDDMKNTKIIGYAGLLAGLLFLAACDPNKDLYDKLDAGIPPHSESIEYTLTDSDYNRFSGFIAEYKAFNDTLPAMDYIPEILSSRFVTLNLGSNAMVTFNHFLLHPEWWDAGFGYELTEDDYAWLGVGNAFTPNAPAWQNVPFLLNRDYPDAEEGFQVKIIYNFLEEGEMTMNEDTYEFDGQEWLLIDTREDIPYVGYELVSEDYDLFGGSVGQFNNFSEEDPPGKYLPVFLKNHLPYAIPDTEQVLRYRYYDGTQTRTLTDKFIFDGLAWEMVPYVEERTEQYIFGEEGWAFDPTVIFTLGRDDYLYLVEIDPVGQQEFQYDDFAYYYGASGFYTNFDIRIIGRRLDKLEDGSYADEALGEIYETEGADAVMEEMIRRIIEEGFIYLLQHKFPDAQPQVGGIDVHYFLRFETFADNWVRRFPEAEYICTAPGDPPQFELVNFIENIE